MICKKCSKEFQEDWRKNSKTECLFCSRECSNYREHSGDTIERISKSVFDFYKDKKVNDEDNEHKVRKECPICNKTFYTYLSRRHSIYCSKECSCADKTFLFKKKPEGGIREGSGISKSGTYKGFYCGSSWELCYYIYNLDNGIPIERCKDFYIYEDSVGNKRRYYPDFVIGESVIEIKGPQDKLWEYKLKCFPRDKNLEVLYKEDIQFYINYVKQKYGNPFELFD